MVRSRRVGPDTTLIPTDMPPHWYSIPSCCPRQDVGLLQVLLFHIGIYKYSLNQLAFLKISVWVWVIFNRFAWLLNTVNLFKSRVLDFVEFWCRAFGFCGFGIWDSVGFGFRIFGDLGFGGNELVNGLGNYGIGE